MSGLITLDSHKNEKFSQDSLMRDIETAIVNVAKTTSREDFIVSAEDISRMRASFKAAQDVLKSRLDVLESEAEIRRSNLAKYADAVKFVSLGEDCFSRTILTRWGLKRSAKLGEKTHPFDLSVHPLESLIELLASNFEGYLENANLMFSEPHSYTINKRYDVAFNHELGQVFAANDFAKLKSVYNRRMSDFRDDILNAGTVGYVLHIQHPSEKKARLVPELARVLASKWRWVRSALIVINTHPHGTGFKYATQKESPYQVVSIDIDYPFPGYVWHQATHCHTALAHAFEGEIAGAIKGIINDYI